MSYALQDAAWDIKGLKAAAKLVLLRLAHYARDAATAAFPSIETLAEDTGQGARTVQTALRDLEGKGLIRAVGGKSKGGRKCTTRWLLVLNTPRNSHGFNGVETPQNSHGKAETPQNLHVNPAKSAPEPISEPINSGESECARGRSIPTDAEFDEFYRSFPIHRGLGAARAAYVAARSKAGHAEIMEGVLRYQRECEGVDGKWIKRPSRWLAEECWADEPDNRVNGGNNGQQRHPSSGRKPTGAVGGGGSAPRRRGILDGLSRSGLDACGAFAYG